MEIKIAETDKEIMECFEVMSELRPHLVKEKFLSLIREHMEHHQYQLVYLKQLEIKAVMGIRVGSWLHTGKYLEVEEFITAEPFRSQGLGRLMLDWAKAFAKQEGCNQVRLVSGIAREKAHFFYEREGMKFEAKYFSCDVG